MSERTWQLWGGWTMEWDRMPDYTATVGVVWYRDSDGEYGLGFALYRRCLTFRHKPKEAGK